MNDFELLRQFGAQMGADADVAIDVSDRVIQRIRHGRSSMIDHRLSLASIGACVLSAAVIAAAWSTQPANDNLASLSDAAVMATGPDALRSVIEP
ncbi:MAG TPA: hypothetical protein VGG64_00180 [Pirellulales bacterium]|jgi:hypothetical protein